MAKRMKRSPQSGQRGRPAAGDYDSVAEAKEALRLAKEHESLMSKMNRRAIDLNTATKEQGTLQAHLNGTKLESQLIEAKLKELKKSGNELSQEELDDIKGQVAEQKKLGTAINQMFPGAISFAQGIEDAGRGMTGLLGPSAMAVAAFIAIAKLALDFAKNITDTRKELGVSVATAVKLNTQTKLLGMAAKRYGLDVEDIKSAQAAIRNDLGASVQESVKLSLSFARTSAATGQSAEDLAKTLSIMESISGASRDVLLNQIRTNAAMIEAAGIAPALVMKDIAQNAEFFASYAKDGGQNIIQAGIAARKLGLEMSAVSSISESLLDFESSIEKQMEASMLLGRQINLDRARMLALQGDQEGMMQEVLKQVGGEAEFNRMNVIARKKLAESVGVSVEQLSRLVRNNQAAATGGAVGAAVGKPESVYKLHSSGYNETHRLLTKVVRNTEGLG